jgi:DNA-binding GntR family transcriptional regulator
MSPHNFRPDSGKPPGPGDPKAMNKEIYKTIKNRILFLDYQPGEILNENALAKEFRVSRTPMREILYRLEWEQLVRILPRTGTMVTEIEFQKMLHGYQTRVEIEGLVGRMAAEQIASSHLQQISLVRDDCKDLVHRKDLKALAEIDFRFRNILHEAANNPVLKDISDFLYHITFRLWYLTMNRGDWKAEVTVLEQEITQTLESLERKDPAHTGQLRHSYLLVHIERIQAKFFGNRNH